MKVRQYRFEKIEVEAKEVELPKETTYYFETGVRRSIRIIPRFTTWNKTQFGKEEELYELEVVCVYNSFKCMVEQFNIQVSQIEDIYNNGSSNHHDFVVGLINGWFHRRTEEQFKNDLKTVIDKIKP